MVIIIGGVEILEKGSDYSWEVLNFVKLGSLKCWVYDNSYESSKKCWAFDRGIAQVLCFARVIF